MKRALLLLLCAVPLLLPHAAWALRCGTRVVMQGDRDFQVRERCGEPFFEDSYQVFHRSGVGTPVESGIATVYDAWYYNFGPQRFMVRLLFANGELVREDTLGYGFNGTPGPCNLDLVTEGMSSGELFARCGPPAHRRRIYGDTLLRDRATRSAALVPQQREEWYYPGRNGDHGRLVHLLNGRVEDVTTVE